MKKAKWGAPALLFVLVLTAGLTLTACLDPGVGPEGNFNPVGTWRAAIYDPDVSITLTLRANGTFTFIEVWRGVTEVYNGTYIVSGNTIILRSSYFPCWWEGTDKFFIVDNNTLFLPAEGHLVFIRTS